MYFWKSGFIYLALGKQSVNICFCEHVFYMQIINDREVGGKCYGFVTFTNPRSAIDAINDMNGRVCVWFFVFFVFVFFSIYCDWFVRNL